MQEHSVITELRLGESIPDLESESGYGDLQHSRSLVSCLIDARALQEYVGPNFYYVGAFC